MSARLMDRPEDYKKLGINPEQVETWEDGRRNPETGPGNWEWWYFDSILDDGSKAVLQFFTTSGLKNINKDGDTPSVTFNYTTPDGKLHEDVINASPSDCSYSTDLCDVRIESCLFTGDFKKYHIVYKGGKKGMEADLTLLSRAKPYRPGTAYFDFGNGEYYTWLCSVPQGEVTGTITYKGQKRFVHGTGYHDHQWGNRFYLTEWNNWLWARQSFGDYSMLTFDFVTSEKNGFKRFPIVFIEDREGNVVFESTKDVACHVLDETDVDKASGKIYPKTIEYEFHDGDKQVRYRLEGKKILRAQGFKNKPIIGHMIIKKLGMNMSYMRFGGEGSFSFYDGKKEIERRGELIYEFMYPGENAVKYMETERS
ncbi:MAG: lipocalin-like domain-containing protein [Lachnospiraceae bacterium]